MSATTKRPATAHEEETVSKELVVRAGTPDALLGGPVVAVTPESAGWGYSGLAVHELPPGGSLEVLLERDEALVVPLRGDVRVTAVDLDAGRGIDTGTSAALAGRASVFDGPADTAYVPLGSRLTVTAEEGGRVAVATARAGRRREFQVLRAADVGVDLRGAGRASRQVHNYTIGTSLEVDRLLVCEVLTPGGNWSSYPPHKHDAHSDAPGNEERELEEIYYFQVADGPSGPGLGYHRVYGTADRPIDVLAEVRDGDTVLVPHGYHGPSVAAPGYDLYYLNVMAGPADDGRWLSVDDPAHHWVRGTWDDEPVDPRLPLGRVSGPARRSDDVCIEENA